ncbi:hypothetical protein NUSPORA_01235 [Nucleospora cyclopteri]
MKLPIYFDPHVLMKKINNAEKYIKNEGDSLSTIKRPRKRVQRKYCAEKEPKNTDKVLNSDIYINSPFNIIKNIGAKLKNHKEAKKDFSFSKNTSLESNEKFFINCDINNLFHAKSETAFNTNSECFNLRQINNDYYDNQLKQPGLLLSNQNEITEQPIVVANEEMKNQTRFETSKIKMGNFNSGEMKNEGEVEEEISRENSFKIESSTEVSDQIAEMLLQDEELINQSGNKESKRKSKVKHDGEKDYQISYLLYNRQNPETVLTGMLGLLKLKRRGTKIHQRKNFFQTKALQEMYLVTQYPDKRIKDYLSLLLNMELKVINIWFQNKRNTYIQSVKNNIFTEDMFEPDKRLSVKTNMRLTLKAVSDIIIQSLDPITQGEYIKLLK